MVRKISKKFMAVTLAGAMMVAATGCGSKEMSKSDQAKIDNFFNQSTTSSAIYDTTEAAVKNDYVDVECCDESECFNTGATINNSVDNFEIPDDYNTNEFSNFNENSWESVANKPLSSFAADVDTAAYTNLRSYIDNGYDIDPSMIRLEEMINYFHYDYEVPAKDEKFAVTTEMADCPWNKDTKLALVALNTEPIDFSEAPASNIVFLIDTSGSMFDSDKLPLVQQSLNMLAENLTEKDRVSIVTYAGSDEVVLEGVAGNEYHTITSAIEGLYASGSTNGSAGINTAYEIAQKYFIKGGNNRVILATDGDLNVGVTSEGSLEELIKEKKESGVFLSVLGVGYGNYKDNKLETLADKGNGNYAYIDSIFEAKKALVDDLGANMNIVAKDVKLQVEFNPANVKGYRLLGYENRVMADQDFNDDTKDGGEMGAGHTVTALYEVALTDSDMDIRSSDLKYSDKESSDIYANGNYDDEVFTLSVRYKEPDADKSELSKFVCKTKDYSKFGSDNLRWAAAVTSFGLCLKNSEYKGDASIDLVKELANSVADANSDEYKAEFLSLVNAYDKYSN